MRIIGKSVRQSAFDVYVVYSPLFYFGLSCIGSDALFDGLTNNLLLI